MERRAFGRWARQGAAALLAALGAAATAAAQQGEIRGLRFGSHAEYDRVVLELGAAPVAAAYQAQGEELRLELEAAPPVLAPAQRQRLAALGVALGPGPGGGTRLAIARRGRAAAAFRLGGTGVPRIVLDLGKSGAPLQIPADAQALPQSAAAAGELADAAPVLGDSALKPVAAPAVPRPPPLLGENPPAAATPPPLLGESAAVSAAPRSAPEPAQAVPAPEEVWVRLGSIEFEGAGAGELAADALLELELDLARTDSGDWQVASALSAAERRKLRELAAASEQAPRIAGSVLQQIVERIAERYATEGLYGTRIDIRRGDLEPLLGGQPGPLLIRIQTPPPGAR